LRVDVGDRGPGILETELPHIFERFYRLAGVEEPGSGLGLSIAQTIVEATAVALRPKASQVRGPACLSSSPCCRKGARYARLFSEFVQFA
jgi:K+-sensing histidine kinase KdpD